MTGLVARHPPPTIRPQPPFPALVDAIVSQQISGKAAASIMARLAEVTPIRPATLAVADPRRLRSAGLSRAKATYVRELARFARAGGLRGLSRMSDAAVVERLVQVKGIGVWTAEMLLIFSLNRPDVWPVGDGGIQRAAARLYRVHARSRLQRLGERFRPVRSSAAWYLWRSLEEDPG